MATMDDLLYEIEMRGIVLRKNTTLWDGTKLGYEGDPNDADPENSSGEMLLYYAPEGAIFIDSSQSPSISWRKAEDVPGGVWVVQLDMTGPGGTVGDDLIIDRYTLNATDITNGYVTLSQEPNPNELKLEVKGAPSQQYNVDFKINDIFSLRVEWTGLGLEGSLEENDQLTVTYTKL